MTPFTPLAPVLCSLPDILGALDLMVNIRKKLKKSKTSKANDAEQTGMDDLNVHFSLKIKSESLPFIFIVGPHVPYSCQRLDQRRNTEAA